MPKTYLGQFFEEQEKEQNAQAYKLAERMQIDPALISKVKAGQLFTPNKTTLEKMIAGISRDPVVKTKLMMAVLKDVRDRVSGYPREAIQIASEFGQALIAEESPEPAKSADVQWLLEAIETNFLTRAEMRNLVAVLKVFRKNPAVRRMISNLAEVAESK